MKELVEYCRQYADSIYVRCQLPNGKWGNMPLSECPSPQVLQFLLEWERRGQLPARVV